MEALKEGIGEESLDDCLKSSKGEEVVPGSLKKGLSNGERFAVSDNLEERIGSTNGPKCPMKGDEASFNLLLLPMGSMALPSVEAGRGTTEDPN